MAEYLYLHKLPVKGDCVIDKRRILHQKGEIIRGVYDYTNPEREFLLHAYVKFTSHNGEWYDAKELAFRWVSKECAYILT